jgi:hypothetical protein
MSHKIQAMNNAEKDVFNLFKSNGINPSYSLNHTLFAWYPRRAENPTVELTCLLHGVDDPKYFQTHNYYNARAIIRGTFPNLEDDVIKCLDLLSNSSSNNNSRVVYTGVMSSIHYTIRHIVRYIVHHIISNMFPELYSDIVKMIKSTTKPPEIHRWGMMRNHHDLIMFINTTNRFEFHNRVEYSESVIDHFYDYLLYLRTKTGDADIDTEMKRRQFIIMKLILNYWKKHQ